MRKRLRFFLLAVAVTLSYALPMSAKQQTVSAKESVGTELGEMSAFAKFNQERGIRTIDPEYSTLPAVSGYMTEVRKYVPSQPELVSSSNEQTPTYALTTTFLTANVVYNGGLSTTFKTANRMARFLPTEASSVYQLSSGYVYANGGGFYADGIYYSTYYTKNSTTGAITNVYNRTYNATTWAQTKSTSVLSTKGLSTVATAVSYDVVTEKAYGCFYTKDGAGLVFASLDKSFNVTEIAPIASGFWLSAAFDGKGTLYVIDEKGVLSTVNLSTGALTTIGNTGLASGFYTSGAIDPRNGTFYYLHISSDGGTNPTATSLYTIDKTTAKAIKIYDFAGIAQMYGMYVAPPAAEDKAPAAVANIKFDFSEGSLAGKISFNAPSKTYDGENGEGNISYAIVYGIDTIATGTTAYGANAIADVTFDAAGKKTVSVACKSAAGWGPSLSATSTWLGPDKPKAVTGLAAKLVDGKINLSWTAPALGVNSGYINPDSIKYTVNLTAPEKLTLVTGLKETSCEYAPKDPEDFKTYGFTVAATFNGQTSATSSASITIGSILPPYSHKFTTAATLNGYTIIDANGDNSKWALSQGHAALLYQNKRASDDYLVTPGMRLEGGKIYTFAFNAKGFRSGYIEKFRVMFGKEATVEGLTQALSDTITFDSEEFLPYKFSVRVPETGKYYFAIHGISPNINENGYLISQAIYVNNIEVSAAISPQAPVAPSISCVPDNFGELKVKVSVKAPTVDIDNKTLSALDSIVVSRAGVAIKTFKGVTPGETYSFTDENATAGLVNYSAAAYNASGCGLDSVAQVFVGYSSPLPVAKVTVVEQGNTGKVNITWDPVLHDVNGLTYKEGDVTYTVYDKTGSTVVLKDLTDAKCELQALAEGERDFVVYYITAVTAKGVSARTASNLIPLGPAYELAFKETYPDGKLYSPLGFEVSMTNMVTVKLATDTSDGTLAGAGVTASDGDNGFLSNKFWAKDVALRLYTSKIDLTKASNPIYSVDTYAFKSSATGKPAINDIALIVRPMGEEDWKVLRAYNSADMNSVGWNTLTASLNDYKGKVVQVGIYVLCTGMTYALFDNMKIGDEAVIPTVADLNGKDDNNGAVELTWNAPANLTQVINGTPVTYEIDGYNVYRDGTCVTEAPIKATTYVDSKINKGSYEYYVTAVYKTYGESDKSNVVKVTLNSSGVESIEADDNSDVEYYNIQGLKVAKENLAPGVYVVKKGDKFTKVLVQ